jgi:hypothetical protein
LGHEEDPFSDRVMAERAANAIGTTPGVFTRDECEAFLQEQVLTIERI